MKKLLASAVAIAVVIGVIFTCGCGMTSYFPGLTPTAAPSPTWEQSSWTLTTPTPSSTPFPMEEEGLSFSTTDIYGRPVSFSDFSNRKVIMINFWETWCPPCMEELHELEALYETYVDRGFVILGVCGSSTVEDIRAAVADIGLTYPVFMGTEELDEYRTQYVPTTWFFGGDGEPLHEDAYIGSKSGLEWERILLQYLDD